jgi:hypothetical protein
MRHATHGSQLHCIAELLRERLARHVAAARRTVRPISGRSEMTAADRIFAEDWRILARTCRSWSNERARGRRGG